MDNINTSATGKTITRREIALGVLSKKIYQGDGKVARFISDDSVVKFDVSTAYHTNAEFTVNGDANWKMWFSQFDPVYIREDDLKLEGGTITVDGTTRLIATLSVDDFISLIRGRRFKVTFHPDRLAMDFRKNDKCRRFSNAGAVQKHIVKALDEERYDDVEGILKVMPMYDLAEVDAEERLISTRGCRHCDFDDIQDALLEEAMYYEEQEAYEDYWDEEAAMEDAYEEQMMEEEAAQEAYEEQMMEEAMMEEAMEEYYDGW